MLDSQCGPLLEPQALALYGKLLYESKLVDPESGQEFYNKQMWRMDSHLLNLSRAVIRGCTI